MLYRPQQAQPVLRPVRLNRTAAARRAMLLPQRKMAIAKPACQGGRQGANRPVSRERRLLLA